MLLTKYGNRSCSIQKEIDGRGLIAISHLRVSGDLHVKRIIKLLIIYHLTHSLNIQRRDGMLFLDNDILSDTLHHSQDNDILPAI